MSRQEKHLCFCFVTLASVSRRYVKTKWTSLYTKLPKVALLVNYCIFYEILVICKNRPFIAIAGVRIMGL